MVVQCVAFASEMHDVWLLVMFQEGVKISASGVLVFGCFCEFQYISQDAKFLYQEPVYKKPTLLSDPVSLVSYFFKRPHKPLRSIAHGTNNHNRISTVSGPERLFHTFYLPWCGKVLINLVKLRYIFSGFDFNASYLRSCCFLSFIYIPLGLLAKSINFADIILVSWHFS